MGTINIDLKTFVVASIFYLVIIIILLIRVNSVLRKKIIEDYKRDLRSVRHSIIHNLFVIALKDVGGDETKKEKLRKIIDTYENEYLLYKNDSGYNRIVFRIIELDLKTDFDLNTLVAPWVGGLDNTMCAWNVSREVCHMYARACLFNKELDILFHK